MLFARMRRPFVVLVAVAAGMVFVAPAEAATWGPDVNGCTGQLDNPHYSAGSAGVIVKSRYTCSQNVDLWQETVLFWCGTKYPQANETWLNNNCGKVGRNVGWIYSTVPYHTYTRYAPPGGGGSPSGGFYMACQTAVTYGVFASNVHLIFSNPYFYDAPIPQRAET